MKLPSMAPNPTQSFHGTTEVRIVEKRQSYLTCITDQEDDLRARERVLFTRKGVKMNDAR